MHNKQVFFVITLFLAFLVSCSSKSAAIQLGQAIEIAHQYFAEQYGKYVVVNNTKFERISQSQCRNIITVNDGKTEYRLMLDEQNKPFADDVIATDIRNNIDISLFSERLESLGLRVFEYYDLSTVFNEQEERYIINLSVVLANLPIKTAKTEVYILLKELRNIGVDNFVIVVNSPDFLRPRVELGHGGNGIQLDAEFFNTGIDEATFEDQYMQLSDRIHWDKDLFDKKIAELAEIGYENAYFFISQRLTVNTMEIILYCESRGSLSDEQAAILLQCMADSYLKIGGRETKYSVQLIYKYQ